MSFSLGKYICLSFLETVKVINESILCPQNINLPFFSHLLEQKNPLLLASTCLKFPRPSTYIKQPKDASY